MLVLPRPLQRDVRRAAGVRREGGAARRASSCCCVARTAASRRRSRRACTAGARTSRSRCRARSCALVMEDCTSVLTADASLDPRFQGQQSIVAQAVHSAMAVPLFDNETVLGAALRRQPGLLDRVRRDQDLELLTLLANMAAVKITNARLLEAETARAAAARRSWRRRRASSSGFLPGRPPKLAGYALDALPRELLRGRRRSATTSIVAPDGRLMFVVGDVSGKGMGRRLLMSSFLASARVLYDTCRDPSELAIRLGSIIHRGTDSRHFITAVVGCLEPRDGDAAVRERRASAGLHRARRRAARAARAPACRSACCRRSRTPRSRWCSSRGRRWRCSATASPRPSAARSSSTSARPRGPQGRVPRERSRRRARAHRPADRRLSRRRASHRRPDAGAAAARARVRVTGAWSPRAAPSAR